MFETSRRAMRLRGARSTAAIAVLTVAATALAGTIHAGASAPKDLNPKNEGKPRRGGSVVYGVEAETNGGFCLPSAQLALAGIEVAFAVYDTLAVVNDKGKIVPLLAKSIDHNPDYTQWTFHLRDGVKFHDGTPVDAAAIKLNLDAYSGKNPDIFAPLFSTIFKAVKDVVVVDPLTVQVNMSSSWPQFLWQNVSRVGMVAPAQLNDKENCATKLIGSGPFKFQEWKQNDRLVVTRNPDYWQKGLPYLNKITFKPVPDASQRTTGLQAGQLDLIHTTSGRSINTFKQEATAGQANLWLEPFANNENRHYILNNNKAPFDDQRARSAFAMAFNRKNVNEVIKEGVPILANGPFAKKVPGYLKNPGWPKYNKSAARKLVQEYTAEKGDLNVTFLVGGDTEELQEAQLVKQNLEAVGMKVTIRNEDQAQEINDALAGDFSMIFWRNMPGADPDANTMWWISDSPINFGKINDPELDALSLQGREELNPAKRVQIYQDINRLFAKKIYNIWAWFETWAVAAKPNVHGVLGAKLPDGGGRQIPMLAGFHPLSGIWVDK